MYVRTSSLHKLVVKSSRLQLLVMLELELSGHCGIIRFCYHPSS
jgi:hypothetical protein